MTNILFIWSKIHIDISYRQGMNELLAPIIWVMYHDSIKVSQEDHHHKNDLLLTIVHKDYIEDDSYYLFNQLMLKMNQYFQIKLLKKKGKQIHTRQISIINEKADHIMNLLKKIDVEVYNYLIQLQIPYNIFLLRWIRLLFTREYDLKEIFILWDTILVMYDKISEIIDAISLSMILYQKQHMINNENYSDILNRLMKYPKVKNIRNILEKAIEIHV